MQSNHTKLFVPRRRADILVDVAPTANGSHSLNRRSQFKWPPNTLVTYIWRDFCNSSHAKPLFLLSSTTATDLSDTFSCVAQADGKKTHFLSRLKHQGQSQSRYREIRWGPAAGHFSWFARDTHTNMHVHVSLYMYLYRDKRSCSAAGCDLVTS